MERKLIAQGGGKGFTIYLPKKWVEGAGLEAGDSVTLVDTKDGLLVSGSKAQKRETVVTVTKENQLDIRHILTHAYRNGFDRIEIRNAEQKILDETKEIVNDLLLGFEITSREKGRCVLENVTEPAEEKHEVIQRKAFLLIKETMQILITGFEERAFRDVGELRALQDKYILFCRRTLIRSKYKYDPILEWELFTFLMHIEHGLYYLNRYAIENGIGKDSEVAGLLRELQRYFNLFYQAFYKQSIGLIHKINKGKAEYHFGKCYEMIEEAKGKRTVILALIREIFRLVQVATSPVLSGLIKERVV